MSSRSSECVAQCPTPLWQKILFVVLLIVAIITAVLGTFAAGFMLAALGAGAGAYFLHKRRNMEYEYCFLDDELRVYKIIGQSTRKHLYTFDTEKIEIIAPAGSKHLTPYRPRNVRTVNYSGAPISAGGGQYEMYYDRQMRVLLTLSEGTFTALRYAFPGKVFRNEDFCIY